MPGMPPDLTRGRCFLAGAVRRSCAVRPVPDRSRDWWRPCQWVVRWDGGPVADARYVRPGKVRAWVLRPPSAAGSVWPG